MAAAAPGITSGFKTEEGGKDWCQAMSLTWPLLATREASEVDSLLSSLTFDGRQQGQSLSIVCCSLKEQLGVYQVVKVMESIWDKAHHIRRQKGKKHHGLFWEHQVVSMGSIHVKQSRGVGNRWRGRLYGSGLSGSYKPG